MMNLFKNLFRIAKLLSVDDSGDLRFGRVAMLGKNQKVNIFSPYGLMHCPPEKSMVLMLMQVGQESNGIGIADDPANRTLRNMAGGEVALGNYKTGHYIYFKEDGTCVVVADKFEFQGDDADFITNTLTHNGVNVGDDHTHPQGADSDGDSQVDTGGPQ